MAGPKEIYNTYEEDPDELKNFLNEMKLLEEFPLTPLPTRASLLDIHNAHLQLLVSGRLQPHKFILPLPYPPSRTTTSQTAHVCVKSLSIDTRDETAILFLRTIAEPYVHSSSITIVEDELGDVARLTIRNLEDTPNDPTITLGSIVAVKQPCWTIAACGDYHIRVDHPSDLIILKPGDPAIPLTWRKTINVEGAKIATEWKKEGDMMFLKKKFRKALGW
jgi:hypothetical protein